VLAAFQADQHTAFEQVGGTDLSTFTTCEIMQVLPPDFAAGGTCKNNTAPSPQGWCYITNEYGCAQNINFSPNGLPPGAVVSLQCPANQ